MGFDCALALLPMLGTAFAISKVVCGYFDSMARNPEGDKNGDRKTMLIISIAAIELMALLSFVIAVLLYGVKG